VSSTKDKEPRRFRRRSGTTGDVYGANVENSASVSRMLVVNQERQVASAASDGRRRATRRQVTELATSTLNQVGNGRQDQQTTVRQIRSRLRAT